MNVRRRVVGAGGGVDVEGERLVAAVETAVDALELLAIVPSLDSSESIDTFFSADGVKLKPSIVQTLSEHLRAEEAFVQAQKQREDDSERRPEVDDGEADVDWADDDAVLVTKSLHGVVALLSNDKATRDALRQLSATRISSNFTMLVHALTDLIQLAEVRLATTVEQDESRSRNVRDAAQRLRECQDDATQLRFELAKEREARQSHVLKHSQLISSLREQLRDTQRQASEEMRATQRTADHDAQSMRSQFEVDKSMATEKWLALARVDGRAADAHQSEEADERKRLARVERDLDELIGKYDDEMTALEHEMEREQRELQTLENQMATLHVHFEKVDQDRHYELEEERFFDLQEQLRRRKELNLFRFITRMQALVRGFLTRRHVRLSERLQKKKKKKSKKKKTKTKKTSPTKKALQPTRPTRPASAAASSRGLRRAS